MTTPESDPYADSGGSDWEVRPAVPGWSAGRISSPGRCSTTPAGISIYPTSTGLAAAPTASRADHPGRVDGYGPPVVSSRRDRQDLQAGNGVASHPAAPGSQDERTTGWPEQPPARTGRRDRRAWPDRPAPAGRPEPEPQAAPSRRTGQTAGPAATRGMVVLTT